ncbi:hypothetical protein D3C72_2190480 [compost metagenome]
MNTDLLEFESSTANVLPVDCGVGKAITKSTVLLLVSTALFCLVIEFKIVGDGAAPEPSY